MRKLYRKNDSLFQRVLCAFQPGHIVPFHVWLVGQNSTYTKYLENREAALGVFEELTRETRS